MDALDALESLPLSLLFVVLEKVPIQSLFALRATSMWLHEVVASLPPSVWYNKAHDELQMSASTTSAIKAAGISGPHACAAALALRCCCSCQCHLPQLCQLKQAQRLGHTIASAQRPAVAGQLAVCMSPSWLDIRSMTCAVCSQDRQYRGVVQLEGCPQDWAGSSVDCRPGHKQHLHRPEGADAHDSAAQLGGALTDPKFDDSGTTEVLTAVAGVAAASRMGAHVAATQSHGPNTAAASDSLPKGNSTGSAGSGSSCGNNTSSSSSSLTSNVEGGSSCTARLSRNTKDSYHQMKTRSSIWRGLSDDGRSLVVGSWALVGRHADAHSLSAWNLDTGKAHDLSGVTPGIMCMAADAGSLSVATISFSHRLVTWDVSGTPCVLREWQLPVLEVAPCFAWDGLGTSHDTVLGVDIRKDWTAVVQSDVRLLQASSGRKVELQGQALQLAVPTVAHVASSCDAGSRRGDCKVSLARLTDTHAVLLLGSRILLYNLDKCTLTAWQRPLQLPCLSNLSPSPHPRYACRHMQAADGGLLLTMHEPISCQDPHFAPTAWLLVWDILTGEAAGSFQVQLPPVQPPPVGMARICSMQLSPDQTSMALLISGGTLLLLDFASAAFYRATKSGAVPGSNAPWSPEQLQPMCGRQQGSPHVVLRSALHGTLGPAAQNMNMLSSQVPTDASSLSSNMMQQVCASRDETTPAAVDIEGCKDVGCLPACGWLQTVKYSLEPPPRDAVLSDTPWLMHANTWPQGLWLWTEQRGS